MDLHFTAGPADAEEHSALDALAAMHGDLSMRRDLLLPALHAVSNAVGWISRPAIDEIGRRLHVAPADVYGVASFYASFTFEPASTRVVRVCEDLACTLGGPVHAPPSDDTVRYEAVPCLGQCERAPAQLVTVRGAVADAVDDPAPVAAVPQAGDPSLVLLRRVGVVDPTSIDDYQAHGGYDALRRAAQLGAGGVLQHVAESGLVGRGGAAFPDGA